MPRVNVAKARKDYPDAGIKKGDTYYSWTFYRGPTYRSKTYPRASQLTQSAWSDILAAHEAIDDWLSELYTAWGKTAPGDEEWTAHKAETIKDDLAVMLRDELGQTAQDAADEKRELADEHFGGEGPHAEQADAMEEVASEADSAASEVEGVDLTKYEDDDGGCNVDWEDFFEQLQECVNAADPSNYQV